MMSELLSSVCFLDVSNLVFIKNRVALARSKEGKCRIIERPMTMIIIRNRIVMRITINTT